MPVARRLPAMNRMWANLRAARTGKRVTQLRNAFFQRHRVGQYLEHGARLICVGNRLVFPQLHERFALSFALLLLRQGCNRVERLLIRNFKRLV